MNFSIINLVIIVMIFLMVLEYKNNNNNLLYFMFSFLMVYVVLDYSLFLDSNLFCLDLWKILFLGLMFSIYMMIIELINDKSFDIYCLSTLVFIGSILLMTCNNLMTLYLGLELQTFSVFILVAKNSYSIKSSEAGLKYFMLGALSSGFYLLGLTILFLTGFSLELTDLVLLCNENMNSFALGLLTLSFCFKLTLFPLHFWIPDMYEGSSWDIISMVSTLPKISMISVIIQILINSNLILSFSVLSIIMGTLGSLNQSKIKRLLGYSGMSHMGFMMLGFTLISQQGFLVSNLYLIMYMLTMICLFILIMSSNFGSKYIIELSSLKFINKLYSISFILLMLSVAGMPPLSGFMSKWFLLLTTMDSSYNMSSFMIMLFSAMGAGYYLSIVKMMYFQKKSSFFLWKNILLESSNNEELNILVLGFLLFISLFLMLNFSFIIDVININFLNLR